MTAPLVRVTRAADAEALDRATIDAGVPSRALMQRAGAAAAAEIARRYADRCAGGVALFAGTGNNGGDAWVVARALAAAGVRCRVTVVGEPRTSDARDEQALALAQPGVTTGAPSGTERLVVDGLLGIGASGRPRDDVAAAVSRIGALRASGALVVALDVPSGVDATTGEAEGAVHADLTLTFGTCKRGLLVARDQCGAIAVLDIGLLAAANGARSALLVDGAWVRARIPGILADAHKGTRRKLAIVGGAVGMAGAAVLAARAAAATGVGMVRLLVAPASLAAVQAAAPEALAAQWPLSDAEADETVGEWADTLLVGPGLSATAETRALVERLLRRWRGPVVLDADALNVFAGDAAALAALLGGRSAAITPHPAEFARLTGSTIADVLAERFERGAALAAQLGAAVLLKGVPTVVSGADGGCLVSAAGTPALAAAGSGDLLAGIAATLLAQSRDATEAAACAAWAHGRAAELATGEGGARGVTLADVTAALPRVWREWPAPPAYPVIAELPAVR